MSKEKGSISIIVLAAMVAILGIGAIVIDGGMLYYERAKHQTAVDGAALAGARAFVKNGYHAALQAAGSIAEANSLLHSEYEVVVNSSLSQVQVSSAREVSMGLARILNSPYTVVGATATAGGMTVSAMRNAAPLGVIWQDFVFNQVYELKVGAGSSDSGWYGALALGGTGASTYRNNMASGWSGWLRVGDQVPTETGNMVNPTRQGVQDRLNSCTHSPSCTYDNYVAKCPKLMIIPIISGPPNGRGEVTVLGFAGFFVDEFVGKGGGESFIRGRFIEFVADGEAGPAGKYGAVTIELLR